MSAHDRTMPITLESEQAALGAVLMHHDLYPKLSRVITPTHFAEEIHRHLWSVIGALAERGDPLSVPILLHHIGDPDLGEGVTARDYLARLRAEAPARNEALAHAQLVRTTAARRAMISACTEIEGLAYDLPLTETVETVFARFERRLEEVRPEIVADSNGFRDFGSISNQDLYDAYRDGAAPLGHSTGLDKLDDVMGNLRPTDLIVLAGRPGSGKTALAANIAVRVAQRLHARRQSGERAGVVAFFSLEMKDVQIKRRILSDLAEVEFWKLDRRKADGEELTRVAGCERDFDRLPFFIDDTGGLSIAQVAMRARQMHRREKLELIVVDYLQLLSGSKSKGDNRVQEVTEITVGLKALAKELDVPIIALSQLSRKVEERDDKRPLLSDLRESGSIEQDADVVIFVYREEYYLKNMKPRKEHRDAFARWERAMDLARNVAELNVAKNRHGASGVVEVGFYGEFTRFVDDPPERPVDPEEVREKVAKRPALTPDGTTLHGLLKSLASLRGEPATEEQLRTDPRLLKGARLINVDLARAEFASLVLGPDAEEGPARERFTRAFSTLSKAGIAFYTGSAEAGWLVWLPELVA